MAANFKVGETVKLVATIPTGPVLQLAVDQKGDISYLVEWSDGQGTSQQTWFQEAQLVAA